MNFKWLFYRLDDSLPQGLLVKKELVRLLGKNNRYFLMLICMILLSMGAVSYSLGNYRFLRERIHHPFMSWIPLKVYNNLNEKWEEIEAELIEEDIKATYHLQQIDRIYYKNFKAEFPSENPGNSIDLWVGVLPSSDSLVRKIFTDSEIKTMKYTTVHFDDFFNEDSCAIILHKNFLLAKGIDPQNVPEYLHLRSQSSDAGNEQDMVFDMDITLKVAGVVDRFPLDVEAVIPNHLLTEIKNYEMLYFPEISKVRTQWPIVAMVPPTHNADSIFTDIQSLILATSGFMLDTIVSINQTFSNQEISSYELVAYVSPRDSSVVDQLNMVRMAWNIRQQESFFPGKDRQYLIVPGHFSYNNQPDRGDLSAPSTLMFRFEKLNKLQEFAKYLSTTYEATISMDYIESRDNFRRVTGSTFILIIVLVVFSVISVFLYLDGILTRHIRNSMKTIGAIKAFGMDNKKMMKVYQIVLLRFIGSAVLISYLILCVLFVLFGLDWFSIFHWLVPAIGIFIFLCSYYMISFSLSHILTRTPGDLIKSVDS